MPRKTHNHKNKSRVLSASKIIRLSSPEPSSNKINTANNDNKPNPVGTMFLNPLDYTLETYCTNNNLEIIKKHFGHTCKRKNKMEEYNPYYLVKDLTDKNEQEYYITRINHTNGHKVMLFSTIDIEIFLYPCGSKDRRTWKFNNGYVDAQLNNNKRCYFHILACEAKCGVTPENSSVDHINRNKFDNRRSNLRMATQSEQNANRDKIIHKEQKYDEPGVPHILPHFIHYRPYNEKENRAEQFECLFGSPTETVTIKNGKKSGKTKPKPVRGKSNSRQESSLLQKYVEILKIRYKKIAENPLKLQQSFNNMLLSEFADLTKKLILDAVSHNKIIPITPGLTDLLDNTYEIIPTVDISEELNEHKKKAEIVSKELKIKKQEELKVARMKRSTAKKAGICQYCGVSSASVKRHEKEFCKKNPSYNDPERVAEREAKKKTHYENVTNAKKEKGDSRRLLNYKQTLEIKKLKETTNMTNVQIGAIYNVDHRVVSRVINGKYKTNEKEKLEYESSLLNK